jgi:aryl-alcohol dehydrogenase-like predicted oxidoreductase
VLATKFGGAGSGQNIRRAIAGSLRRLRTDYIDLYQYHVPDGVTPIEETLAALTELVREGKVRYIGSSNAAAWQIAEADHAARHNGYASFTSTQTQWSLLAREAEREIVPAAVGCGIGVLPYFPLAHGLLTGKVRRGQPPPHRTRLAEHPDLITPARLDTVEALASWADGHGRSLLEVAIAALASLPGCGSVIAGVTSAEHVRVNAHAAAWLPSPEDIAEITTLAPAR